MAILQIVPLPEGTRAALGPAFAMILEIGEDERFPLTDVELEEMRTFSRDAGAAALLITDRNITVFNPAPSNEPGPCPSYMEGMGTAHVCDLRAGHEGLHEENTPGAGDLPPTRATWGERERFDHTAGFTSLVTRAERIDLSKLAAPGGHRHLLAEPCTDECYGGPAAAVLIPSKQPLPPDVEALIRSYYTRRHTGLEDATATQDAAVVYFTEHPELDPRSRPSLDFQRQPGGKWIVTGHQHQDHGAGPGFPLG